MIFKSIEECAGNWNQFYEVENFGYQKSVPCHLLEIVDEENVRIYTGETITAISRTRVRKMSEKQYLEYRSRMLRYITFANDCNCNHGFHKDAECDLQLFRSAIDI